MESLHPDLLQPFLQFLVCALDTLGRCYETLAGIKCLVRDHFDWHFSYHVSFKKNFCLLIRGALY